MISRKKFTAIITILLMLTSTVFDEWTAFSAAEIALTQNLDFSQNSDIKCNVNLMYDDAYCESIMIKNKQLNIPVEITNTSGEDKNIVCYIGEYDADGKLIGTLSSTNAMVESGQTYTANIKQLFDDDAYTAKIFMWDSETIRPITSSIKLTETSQDYYADNISDAQLYDLNYYIKGNIDDVSDVDYVKFMPESTGQYTFNCISAVNTLSSLYNSNKYPLKTGESSFKYNLTAGQTYYLKIYNSSSIGEYIVSVQYDTANEADSFSIYDFDMDTNVYKKSALNMCEDLYYEDAELSKQMYNEYENILNEETKLHRLPDFLAGHPKELADFDEIVNQYYSTKYNSLAEVRQKYIDLIDKYTENDLEEIRSSDNETANSDSNVNNEYPIIGKHYPESYSTDGIEDTEDNEHEISDLSSEQCTASLTITSTTSMSITYNATFPFSGAKGNAIYLVDFNKSNGLTTEYNVYGANAIHRTDGTYTITGLQPGGIYILEMLWSTDGGNNYGGENSIDRFVQLPCNTTENLQMYENGGRVSAYIESEDKVIAADGDFNAWLNRMDKAYGAFRELTGYTPYNSQKIVMASTRNNLNEQFGNVDGENYWWVTFGYYDHTRIFKHSKAFNQGHMRRLSQGDWGDTPMHELSHTFDYYNWVFDAETLAQFKLYYVVSTLNAKTYRPDRFNNNGNGWYTGTNYYTLLKTDRYLDSYTNSFDKGNYASEGFAAILIEIQQRIGWESFKKTFRYFSDLSYNQVPSSDGEKLKLFLTKLKDYSGKDVLSYISARDKNIISNHYDTSLEYVTPVVPISSGGEGTVISADKGSYATYAFTPASSGNYYIYTTPYAESGISNDTYIEVYTDASMSSGSMIASNDDYGNSRFSKVNVAMTSGTAYYIKVRHYNNGQLLSQIHITKDIPVKVLNVDGYDDIITAYGEYAMYKFTPDTSGTYVFDVTGYNGGSLDYDTYIKLYENESMTRQIGNDNTKIIVNLKEGQTYYLQFSGYFMRYARGRINVRQGQTLQFTKRSDSSFIYVNSPEYLTRIDIVDDVCHSEKLSEKLDIQPCIKVFEQENVTGTNTYYQTHIAWWGDDPKTYEPISDFFMDVDFYNPTNTDITVSVSKLAYGNEYSVLENYYNGNGISISIPIPAHEHRLLFETLHAPLKMSYPGPPIDNEGWDWDRHRSSVILFTFQVNTGNVVISSLAAYDNDNLHLRSGSKNILDGNGKTTENGEIVSDLSKRTNEPDLYGKYKGIAKNQSAWINANLEFVIDELTASGKPLQVNLKDEKYPNGVANPKTWWMTNINPLSDEWDGLIFGMPANEHRFIYHSDIGGIWNFAYDYRDLRDINENATGKISRNNPVPEYILENAALDVAKGQKEHFSRAPDELACGMGAWGATYHYTITVANNTSSPKTISYQAKTFDNMIFGYKCLTDNIYVTCFIPNIGNDESDWTSLKSVTIPANQTITFEIVTLLGGGHGGTNNRIILN